MNYKDVFVMPNELFMQFWQAITVLEARQMLMDMKTADYPGAKKESRSKIHKSIYKLAYPKTFEDKPHEEKMRDAFKILSGLSPNGKK